MRSQISEPEGMRRMLRPAAVGVACGALICAAILALMALVISVKTVPQAVLDPVAVFALSVGAFASGFSCARIIRKNGLWCGLFTGVVFALLALVCGFAVPGNSWGLGTLTKVAIILFASMLGGVLGVNTRLRKK
jgi:putative membrane protein (TIGR04086 family)